MIHEKYQGRDSIAITEFNDAYQMRFEISPERLKSNLERSLTCYGQGFKVLKIYDGVGPATVRQIKRVMDRLRLGEKVDLDKILE